MGRKSRESRRVRVGVKPPQAFTGPGSGRAVVVATIAWMIPGCGHFWLGRHQKGIVFLIALPVMFAIGLGFEGRLFSFEASQPLALLAAIAEFGNGLPYLIAVGCGIGEGRVVAETFEYGNTFVIVSGLLNMLVCLDAYDVALGRK